MRMQRKSGGCHAFQDRRSDQRGALQGLDLLGAKSDLLGIVGSWGDTQDDEWVLTELREWNERQASTRDGFAD